MEDRVKNSIRVFDNIAIRDDKIHYPDAQATWVDGFKVDRVVFGVTNDLDQNVSVQPIGRAGAAQGNLGSATTINAGAEGIVSLDLGSYWSPWISVSIKASASPSSGRISIYAIFKERR